VKIEVVTRRSGRELNRRPLSEKLTLHPLDLYFSIDDSV